MCRCTQGFVFYYGGAVLRDNLLVQIAGLLCSGLSTTAINASYYYCYAVHVWQIKKNWPECKLAGAGRGESGGGGSSVTTSRECVNWLLLLMLVVAVMR